MNSHKKTEKKLPLKFTKTNRKRGSGKTVSILLIMFMGAITIYLFSGIVGAGSRALLDSYTNAYTAEKDIAYQTQYTKYYERAEKEYHVKNRVSITFGDLKEIAALEVLTVSDIEYVIENSSDNSDGITSWLEVPGGGTYVVNLQGAEFIVDEQRAYVLVRAPYPELTNISIDYANVKKRLFENAHANDSISIGENLARQQLGSADILIKKEFASNEQFYLSAQKAAINTIQCLVEQLNPDVKDLNVEVEFF